jgi:hypothetical protein
LAFSALYEILEWLASLSNPTDTEAFLGTQGYIWDTQSDMFLCLIGSIAALLILTKLHDHYLRKIASRCSFSIHPRIFLLDPDPSSHLIDFRTWRKR